MRISIISFTQNGSETALRVREALAGEEVRLYYRIEGSLRDWTGARFSDSDAILFIGAAGIAVRSIAPFLISKSVDPAVLCMDEKATWAIPLASGHLGGANALARRIAQAIGAEAVITTATDLNHVFAVDVFAKENDLYLDSMGRAKEVSAALLAGESVGLLTDPEITWEGELPRGLVLWNRDDHAAAGGRDAYSLVEQGRDGFSKNGIRISFRTDTAVIPRKRILHLIPRVLILGVGCRQGTDPEKLNRFVLRILQENGFSTYALAKLCSIAQKKEERALIQFAGRYGIPFETYSAQKLAAVSGSFSASSFVQQTVGVDNVCERSAVLGAGTQAGPGELLLAKQAEDGMTVAVAARTCRLRF